MFDASIHALGVLPDDDRVQVTDTEVRRSSLRDWTHVSVEVEMLAQLEDGGTITGHACIRRGDRAEKAGVRGVQRRHGPVRQVGTGLP